MKRLFFALSVLFALSFEVFAQHQEKLEFGAELGLQNGLYTKYNLKESWSLVGQVGLNYQLNLLALQDSYKRGFVPTIKTELRWYLPLLPHVDNCGIFLSGGLFYDLGRYRLLANKAIEERYNSLWSSGVYTALGLDLPIDTNLTIKAKILMNLGAMEIEQSNSKRIKTRNELLFDLGIIYIF